MARAALLGLLIGGAAASGTELTKWLGPAGADGGLCMDGSPAGIYYRAAPSADSTLWVFVMEGGGACYDKNSCDDRAKGKLGSSKKWTKTLTLGERTSEAFLNEDKDRNPDFHDSHKVWVPYCSGDSHIGQKDKADASTWGYYFSGHLNFRNFLGMLLNDSSTGPHLKAAKNVLFAGESAGGLGVFLNSDYLQSQLPWATVKSVPEFGWFFGGYTDDQPSQPLAPPSDWAHWSKGKTGGSMNQSAINILYNAYSNEDCVKANPSNVDICSSVTGFYPYTKTPMFILENQYDTQQMEGELGVPISEAQSNKQVRDYIAYFGRSMRATITAAHLKKGDGAYLPSCFSHGGGLGIGPGISTIPGAPTQTALIGDWYWERKQIKSYFWADTCSSSEGLPCNPTCDSVPGHGPGPAPAPGPTPPAPGPTPPAPGPEDNCQKQMTSFGCFKWGASHCQKCCSDHKSALTKAGCTDAEEKKLCGS